MDKHGRAGGMLLERLPRRQRRVKGKPGRLRPYQRLRGSADYNLSRMRGASETRTTCWCERGHTIVRHNAGRKRNRDVQLGSTNLKTFEKYPMLYTKKIEDSIKLRCFTRSLSCTDSSGSLTDPYSTASATGDSDHSVEEKQYWVRRASILAKDQSVQRRNGNLRPTRVTTSRVANGSRGDWVEAAYETMSLRPPLFISPPPSRTSMGGDSLRGPISSVS